MIREISDAVKYIGADDPELDLFESQYEVPDGMCYNSYVVIDEKIAVMDTIDERKTDEWFDNLEKVLSGRTPDYLVISHMEPDHAANIAKAAEKYPDMKLVGNAKTFAMLPQFFDMNTDGRTVTVKEGDSLDLGSHKLTFYMAPMVHWPEVMVTYEETEKILFIRKSTPNYNYIFMHVNASLSTLSSRITVSLEFKSHSMHSSISSLE